MLMKMGMKVYFHLPKVQRRARQLVAIQAKVLKPALDCAHTDSE